MVDISVSNLRFYQKEYTSLQLESYTGLNEQDYLAGVDALLAYVKGNRDTIQVDVRIQNKSVPLYNQREIDHMVDVKVLYQQAMGLRNITLVVSVLTFLYLLTQRKKQDGSIYYAFIDTSKWIAGLMIVIIGFAIVDFDLFWTTFHHIFFRNDLWLLNPATDRMIRMFPLELFYDLVFQIIMGSVLAYTSCFILFKSIRTRGI